MPARETTNHSGQQLPPPDPGLSPHPSQPLFPICPRPHSQSIPASIPNLSHTPFLIHHRPQAKPQLPGLVPEENFIQTVSLPQQLCVVRPWLEGPLDVPQPSLQPPAPGWWQGLSPPHCRSNEAAAPATKAFPGHGLHACRGLGVAHQPHPHLGRTGTDSQHSRCSERPLQVLNPKLGQAENSLGQGGNPSMLLVLAPFPLSPLSPPALAASGCHLLASSSRGPAAPMPAIPTGQLMALGRGSLPSSALLH